jgi:hypothetical protein
MKLLRSARWLLLALLVSLVPASSFAGVFISVGFAPPLLPVYEQPICPDEGLMWMPGYWAYGDDGYYWVPGAWVPAPYEGALWTPPYWGWQDGLYVFHEGYWGPHVGYYGGVNYGFGYMGIGFVGGEWREHRFAYNTAVVRVNTTIVRNVYVDRTIVERNTIVNDRRVAFSGGRDGVHHDPRPDEMRAMHEQHAAPTQFQQQHIQAARSDRASYVKFNGGRPQQLASPRPLPAAHVDPPGGGMGRPGGVMNGNPGGRPDMRQAAPTNQPAPNGRLQGQPAAGNRPDMRQAPDMRNEQQQRQANPQYQPQPRPDERQRQAPQPQYQPQQRPEERQRQQYEQQRQAAPPQYQQQQRSAPQPQYQPQQRPEERQRQAPPPQYQQQRQAPQPQYRPAPEPQRQAPPPRSEARPEPRPAPPARENPREDKPHR